MPLPLPNKERVCAEQVARELDLKSEFVSVMCPHHPIQVSDSMVITGYLAFQVACNWAMSCRSSHVIKLKLSSQLIGQFGHVTASASCKQPEKHGMRDCYVLPW